MLHEPEFARRYLDAAEAEFARYTFAVYAPPSPGLPWLSVCIGPDGRMLDSEAFATFEEADLVSCRAQEILFRSLVQQAKGGHVYAEGRALH